MLTKYAEMLEGVEATYDRTKQGRVLIIDGDSFCYKASATSKRLSTAISRFQTEILTAMFMTNSESAIVHLTHKDSAKAGRSKIKGFKPYQANRAGSKRPPLLHEVREAVCRPENIRSEYTVQLHRAVEADDAVMIDSYKLEENGLLWSEDKDLRHTPYPYYDLRLHEIIEAQGIGKLWIHTTPTGLEVPENERGRYQSLHGIGRIFFWAQMLMGDTADDIRGVDKFEGKNIGWKGTYDLLEPYNNTECESVVANLVIDAYREIDQNPIPEGYLLHMMRGWGDSFLDVLEGLELSDKNHSFVWEDCINRDWYEE